jgi:hypothetical protein
MADERDLNRLSDEDFRREIRAWIEANYPPEKRYPPRRLTYDEIRDWFQTLSRQGWIAPNWPREHGGMGLSPAKLIIWVEEYERHGCARLPDHGIQMVGPLLIRYGTEAQRRFFLPKILTGEHIWCQGYSEPNAGSDLASLRTEAVPDGDDYVVNGQKIWTTLAHSANWIFCLVRTDRQARKPQEGISFLLIDMTAPGVTVRPIRNIKGDVEFCEVFFDDLRVPQANRVGEPNKGWTMAKALLGFERIFLGNPRLPEYALNRLRLLGETLGRLDDPAFRDRYTQLRLDVMDLASAFERHAAVLRAGGELGPDVSMLKLWATETYQRITDYMIEVAGDYGALRDDVVIGNTPIDVMNQFLESRPATIYGGSNEIQRNIIAKQVLGLPG